MSTVPRQEAVTASEHIRSLSAAGVPYGDDLAKILHRLIQAGLHVRKALAVGALTDSFRPSGIVNVQQETQQQLDVVAHQAFEDALRADDLVHLLVSEEIEAAVPLAPEGRYWVALDPIDGSSNLSVNIPTGTIFSVHKRPSAGQLPEGTQQLLAGYVLYGSSTLLLYAHEQLGVHAFTFDADRKDFFHAYKNIRTPEKGRIYSVNEGMAATLGQGVQSYLAHCKAEQYTARYVGSLVSDFHRNLLKGGIFIYPATPSHPNGKVRLLYEASPLAFIVRLAGGLAINGTGHDILTLRPTDIHQRTSLCIGSRAMVEAFMRLCG